ncbi:polysaccharide pyruvyl transferase family protein [Novosphingobium sp. RD2P27]|uniref:Polysaccharide pyruvyl transferase family protein n=1 Tax=Novosphingobium kalidii TaxID=3230299 RepID=A0ABV2CXX8_9SPHN
MAKDRVSFLRLSTQFENVGDALINRGLVQNILTHSSLVVDVSSAPSEFVEEVLAGTDKSKVHVVQKGGYAALAKAALAKRAAGKECYFFLLPAGYTGEKNRKAAANYAAITTLMRALRMAGVKLVHLGPSYGALGRRYASLLRSRVRHLDMHLVRDEQSRKLLQSLDVRCDGIVPDMSFSFEHTFVPREVASDIAFSFRTDRNSDADQARTRLLIENVLGQRPESTSIRLVAQVRRDAAFMQQLARELSDTRRAPVAYLEPRTISSTFEAYEGVGEVFSNRLHALLMAAHVGAAPVAYVEPKADAKIVGMFQDLGLDRNLVTEHDSVIASEFSTLDSLSISRRRDLICEAFKRVYR